MENEFKVNDHVKQKNSEVVMIVEAFKWDAFSGVYDKKKVQCSWFDKLDQRHYEEFNSETLELVTSDH